MNYIPPPNYTQMPNAILDAMPELGNAELRVLLVIARQTFGWQKNWDHLSIRRIAGISGLTPRNVQKAINGLMGTYIQRKKEGQYCYYRLRVGGDLEVSMQQVRASAKGKDIRSVSPRDTVAVSPRDTKVYPLGKQQKIKDLYSSKDSNGTALKRKPSIKGLFGE